MAGEDNDRESILARRAVFVTTALAALGCSSQSGGPTATTGTGTATSTATATATATAAPTSSASVAPGALRPWAEVRSGAPPIEVAPSLPAEDERISRS
jgi:nitrous oxide reductase